MPPITAILHTFNDAARLGRALETLHPCDEILVVDHGSTDATLHIARQHAARIRVAEPLSQPHSHTALATHNWIFCLLPSESLSEGLAASLFEWKLYEISDVRNIPACSAFVRVETESGWVETAPSTRLVPRHWDRWNGALPVEDQRSMLLQGDLLRFCRP
jgi:glycosyltransferase involved in cell wall biosynthesis